MLSLNKIINSEKQPDLPIDGIDFSESWLSKKSIQKESLLLTTTKNISLKLLEMIIGNLFLIPIDPTIQLEAIMETREKESNFYKISRTL